MKSYHRILVPILNNGQSGALLQKVSDIARYSRPQVLVVRILDTRSGFEPDGPAAIFPEEAAARRAPAALKRLELQLARSNLGWAEAKVVWGVPKVKLAGLVRAWQPDLVVTGKTQLPKEISASVDVLTTAGKSLFRRLMDALIPPTIRHA